MNKNVESIELLQNRPLGDGRPWSYQKNNTSALDYSGLAEQ
jgi:hypothetical protein